MRKHNRLILALDVTDINKAIYIVKEVSGYVDAIKIGYPLVLSAGLKVIENISEYAPVIADFKVADIPYTSNIICRLAFEADASAIIVHGFTGHDTLEECIKVSREYSKDIFVVTEMSHAGALEYMHPVALKIARIAVECKASGVVAPATYPKRVKEIRNIIGDLTIISPGVGAQGGNVSQAIKSGADYVIVGRSIYNSETPKREAEKIVREIQECR